jgi:hypothetical protein
MSDTLPLVLQLVASHGHAVFTRGLYNLNIVGMRSSDLSAGTFNDRMCVVYRDELGWCTRTWAITTDPGVYWRENPGRLEGTAVLCAGQYRGSHQLGRHRGRYPALVQTGAAVRVWRDADCNATIDVDREQFGTEGYYGINIHRASSRAGGSTEVGKWSAGCQVFADPADYEAFFKLCTSSAELYGPSFTYTLIEDADR